MPKIKLTKTAVDAASPKDRDYELRDTTIPGFLVKVTPAGRKIFMIAYVAHNGQCRKPAIGRYGEITVEQARGIAQDWLAEVRRGVDPSAAGIRRWKLSPQPSGTNPPAPSAPPSAARSAARRVISRERDLTMACSRFCFM